MKSGSNYKKVVLISHKATLLGGAERSFLEMVKILHDLKDLEIIVVLPAKGEMMDLVKPYVSMVKIIHYSWWVAAKNKYFYIKLLYHLRDSLKSIREFNKFFKEIKPDIVLTNTVVIELGAIAAYIQNIKHIWYLREIVKEGHGLYYYFGNLLSLKIINKLSHRIITNSKFIKNYYSKYCNEQKLTVIYQPTGIGVYNKITDRTHDLSIVMTGRVTKSKGQKEAILACIQLLNEGIQLKLNIVGAAEDDYTRELKNISSQYSQNIKIIQFTSQVEPYYLDSNLALVCSDMEGFGRITIEAMKYGLPVIASNRGGSIELIKDGFNGYLYNKNDIDDLAEKIKKFIDQDIRTSLGENAKEWANANFNEEKYRSDLLQVFNDL